MTSATRIKIITATLITPTLNGITLGQVGDHIDGSSDPAAPMQSMRRHLRHRGIRTKIIPDLDSDESVYALDERGIAVARLDEIFRVQTITIHRDGVHQRWMTKRAPKSVRRRRRKAREAAQR